MRKLKKLKNTLIRNKRSKQNAPIRSGGLRPPQHQD